MAVPAAFAQDAQEAIGGAPSAVKAEQARASAKDIAKNIVFDQKQIWSSPFRITRETAKWWLIFGAATGALIATDHRSSQQLPNMGRQVSFSRDVSQLGPEYTLIPIAGALYLSGVLSRQPKLRDTGLLGAEALVDGLIVSEVLKTAAGVEFLAALVRAERLRPRLAAVFAAVSAVAILRTADFPAALAFLNSAHRLFAAAMIRARPSGLRRRFFLAGFACAGVVAAALAFRTAARRGSHARGFVARERHRPLEALRPRDERPDATQGQGPRQSSLHGPERGVVRRPPRPTRCARGG